jgi:hypothetical protein
MLAAVTEQPQPADNQKTILEGVTEEQKVENDMGREGVRETKAPDERAQTLSKLAGPSTPTMAINNEGKNWDEADDGVVKTEE